METDHDSPGTALPATGTLFADPPHHLSVPAYDRSPSAGFREVDRFERGVGWLAHPDETGRRASHAVRGDGGGVWLLDPLDAPGVDDLVAELGEVVGVAVLSNWHARDAGVLARRHGVPVFLPRWMTRVEERVDASVERYSGALGDSGFGIRRFEPFPGWREGIAYRDSDRTLYVPESLGTAPGYVVGGERIGVAPVCRLVPPRDPLGGTEPERVLVGHGAGVDTGAPEALRDAIAGARRRLPRALLENGPTQFRSLFEAFRE